jgi:hypothetical protein
MEAQPSLHITFNGTKTHAVQQVALLNSYSKSKGINAMAPDRGLTSQAWCPTT